ncbi:hypothetical protein BV22DRAFT_14230 [Leucogyrophana mollusca]|uniref:Uncharacterized protein n=1 Tax=Leucogyrophana mollusca TaxID=85980 RepID=A0ACB8C1Y9_9AGAM|nr:hypothetical protein BV22DRAFT_14230 [Leucogyrophana mollusca]
MYRVHSQLPPPNRGDHILIFLGRISLLTGTRSDRVLKRSGLEYCCMISGKVHHYIAAFWGVCFGRQEPQLRIFFTLLWAADSNYRDLFRSLCHIGFGCHYFSSWTYAVRLLVLTRGSFVSPHYSLALPSVNASIVVADSRHHSPSLKFTASTNGTDGQQKTQ